MPKAEILSKREGARLSVLERNQPRSAAALRTLVTRVKQRSILAALRDPKVKQRLQGVRFRAVGADLTEGKPTTRAAERETPVRLVEVGIYDYDQNVLVVPVVDLRKSRVVEIEERRGLQPPITPEEFDEAREIACNHPRLRSQASRVRLEVVAFPARTAFTESSPYRGHRCFTLFFWTGGKKPRMVAEAVVNLSERRILPEDASDLSVLRAAEH